jgi:hypothetical protein
MLVALLAVLLVVVALAKPWAAFEPSTSTVARESTGAMSPTIEATAAPTVPDRRLPRPGAVGRALVQHDTWGVRLVVDALPGESTERGLVELWLPASPAQPGSIPSLNDGIGGLTQFSTAVAQLRLVGLTAPPGITVDDLRLIMARPLGRAAALEVREIVPHRDGTPTILLDRANAATWPPGVYQFRFRLNGQTAAVTFAIFDARPG